MGTAPIIRLPAGGPPVAEGAHDLLLLGLLHPGLLALPAALTDELVLRRGRVGQRAAIGIATEHSVATRLKKACLPSRLPCPINWCCKGANAASKR